MFTFTECVVFTFTKCISIYIVIIAVKVLIANETAERRREAGEEAAS